jgi:ubiquinone/menaquinone biosynthesis C-methylase UbiE
MMAALWGYLQIGYLCLRPQQLFSRLYQLPWYRNTLHQALAGALPKQGRILEVGCAGGDFATELAQRGFSAWGVDRSAHMLRHAHAAGGSACFVRADAMALPFPDLFFDHVFAASLLNVVDQPQAVLKELHRVCRGGVTVLLPATGFSRSDAIQYAKSFSGFSKAAFMSWYLLGKKMNPQDVAALFQACDMQDIQQQALLGGMVLAFYGRRQVSATH